MAFEAWHWDMILVLAGAGASSAALALAGVTDGGWVSAVVIGGASAVLFPIAAMQMVRGKTRNP